jgi:photosystem II stability/assembly factor-like uncharacterized protein
LRGNKKWCGYLTLGAVLILFLTLPASSQSADKVGKIFEKLTWRSIGPAIMGGRTVDIEVDENQPWIIYAAVGPSGVWRSSNNGITWEPVFTKESTVSVGDIALVPSDPKVIWVGSGEATCRNSVTIGDGVYKSTDGGTTWQNMGLRETRHISRIIVDSRNPDTVFVAAMGHLWGPNEERGVFKTTDGGATWRRVLYLNADTGAADLALDPSDSRILYAAMYEHRRLPYRYIDGGKGSGLYKSTDGGETWRKVTKDLPQGIVGRIGINVSRSNPQVVYALVEHAQPGLWRSEDRGENWTRTTDARTYRRVNSRPFYYSQVRVDPVDDKVVYVISTNGYVSFDKGKTYRMFTAGTHVDHHALWIDPRNSLHLIIGNDGGIDISYDQGKNWQAVQSIPAAEVYNIGYDLRNPYFVYCGLQDNHVWGGPSATLESSGIQNSDWFLLGGGDGFYVQPDPSDPLTVYGNSQAGMIFRFNRRIARAKSVRPRTVSLTPGDRFNWNSPIHISPHDPKTLYTAGNRLFVSRDGGQSWAAISPDLTTNDPKKLRDAFGPISRESSGAENHCTITTFCESPRQAGLIWCGTDDGHLQLTRDGGKTWTNVVRRIPGLPKNTWCSRVEASHFAASAAYASFDGHRTDDDATYLYKTTDFGQTWTSIRGNLPFGWVHVIRQDDRNPNFLLVGMEFGVFATLDGGQTWFSLQNNLPTVAVHDLAIHPVRRDLIIGTHGMGIYILDDITALQEMDEKVLASEAHLFSLRPVTQFIIGNLRENYSRPPFIGNNPPYGLILTAHFASKPKTKPLVRIQNDQGEEVYKAELPTTQGLHRLNWNLQFLPRTEKGEKPVVSGPVFSALPFVSPGEFAAALELDGRTFTRSFTVQSDPRFDWPEEERTAQRTAVAEVISLHSALGQAVTALSGIKREAEDLRKQIDQNKDLEKKAAPSLSALENALRPLSADIMPGPFDSGEAGLARMLIMVGASMANYPGRPTEMELSQIKDMKAKVAGLLDRLNAFIRDKLPDLNKGLEQNGLKAVNVPKEVVF